MNVTGYIIQATKPNRALDSMIFAVTFRAPSRTDRASEGHGSS